MDVKIIAIVKPITKNLKRMIKPYQEKTRIVIESGDKGISATIDSTHTYWIESLFRELLKEFEGE